MNSKISPIVLDNSCEADDKTGPIELASVDDHLLVVEALAAVSTWGANNLFPIKLNDLWTSLIDTMLKFGNWFYCQQDAEENCESQLAQCLKEVVTELMKYFTSHLRSILGHAACRELALFVT